jgi:hypothetical protein
MDFWTQMWDGFMNWLRPLSQNLSVTFGADITPENLLLFGGLLIISLLFGGGKVYFGSSGDYHRRQRHRR